MALGLFRRRRTIIALCVLAAIFVLLSLKHPVSRWARRPLMTVVSPVLRAAEAVGRWAGRVGEAIIGRGVGERERLRRQVETLEAEQARLEAELERLREVTAQLDELKERGLEFVPARVIGRDPTSWYETAVLNVGTGSGVRPGMQVVKGAWYVGRIEEVGRGWSRVMLALDARSIVPASVSGRDADGFVEAADDRRLLFRCLADAPELSVGDTIVTREAVLEGKAVAFHFVEGFQIGTVRALGKEEDGWRSAVLERPPRLDRLSDVFVIVGP
jgi:rod shape-determining protein MreC